MMPLGRPPSRLVTWGMTRALPLCVTVPWHPGTVGPLALFNTQRTQLSKDELDLTFNDHRAAYKSKTTSEVARAYLVLTLCGIKPLVKNNDMLMKLGQKVLGKKLFGMIMKQTFYGHFVAGEDQERIKPTIARMQGSVKSGHVTTNF